MHCNFGLKWRCVYIPAFNVIQYTYPDGSHRWKYFTYGQQVGSTIDSPSPHPESQNEPGWTISRKERENATRAKQTVYDLARSNKDFWDWFVTLTFDPALVRRDSYRHCYDCVRCLCDNLTRTDCVYLFVPEHHKDGKSFHFHGLVGGPMTLEYAGKYGPRGREVDTWHVPYFPGFTCVQRVQDKDRVCTYITKYITKDLVHLVPKGCHRYLRSRKLVKPQVEYLTMMPGEFATMVNYGEYFPDDQFLEGIQNARFCKEVPIRYTLNTEHMYIVED